MYNIKNFYPRHSSGVSIYVVDDIKKFANRINEKLEIREDCLHSLDRAQSTDILQCRLFVMNDK